VPDRLVDLLEEIARALLRLAVVDVLLRRPSRWRAATTTTTRGDRDQRCGYGG
jgi:hypothetical protein